MAEMATSKLVGDPVHGYLFVAPHERIIVDHPLTQRLRQIKQTGLAFLVYPEANSTRFIHSLGAMHLASRFLSAALENAEPQDARAFVESVARSPVFSTIALTEVDGALRGGVGFPMTAQLLARSRLEWCRTKADKRDFTRVLTVVEAALRVAALFHDIGHLPFSHDFEVALTEARKAGGPTASLIPDSLIDTDPSPAHEVIGHRLAHLFLQSLLSNHPPVIRAVFALAEQILEADVDYTDNLTQADAFQWLHSLIDGDVDVDRADYLLRDGRALGLDFVTYDIERLTSSLALGRSEQGFSTAISEPGTSALESFLLARTRSNRHLVRHHKVAQVAAAFRYLTRHTFQGEDGTELLRLLANLTSRRTRTDSASAGLLRQFSEVDDNSWWCAMRRKRFRGDTNVSACADVVLRRAPRLECLWKRRGDLTDEEAENLTALTTESLLEHSALEQTRRGLLADGVLVSMHRFRPYSEIADDGGRSRSVLLAKTRLGYRPASHVSEIIRNLPSLVRNDIFVFAFRRAGSRLGKAEVIRRLCGT